MPRRRTPSIAYTHVLGPWAAAALVALRVLVCDDPAAGRTRVAARRQWRRLGRIVAASGIDDVRIVPLVRIAASAAEGILESIAEEGIDCVLLGWHAESEGEIDTVGAVFSATSKCLLIARGLTPETAGQYRIATAGGEHARQALAVAEALAKRHDCKLELVSIPSPGRSPEEAQKAIVDTLEGVSPSTRIETKVLERGEPKAVLLQTGAANMVLLLGASEDPILGRALLTGLPLDMLHRYPGPTLVVKTEEGGGEFWLRRLRAILEELRDRLTSLAGRPSRLGIRALAARHEILDSP